MVAASVVASVGASVGASVATSVSFCTVVGASVAVCLRKGSVERMWGSVEQEGSRVGEG